MADVISFRPTPEERRIIERTRRKHRLGSRSEALRFLVHEGAKADPDDPNQRLRAFRVPPEFQLKGRSLKSEEIDEVAYGDHIWPGTDSG